MKSRNDKSLSYELVNLTTKDLLEKLWNKYDTNGNKRINKFEFIEILQFLTRLTGASFPNRKDIDEVFSTLDVDGDETVSHH